MTTPTADAILAALDRDPALSRRVYETLRARYERPAVESWVDSEGRIVMRVALDGETEDQDQSA